MSGRMASFWLKAVETTVAALALLVPLAFLLRSYDASSIKTTLLEAGALALAAGWLVKGLERGRWEVPAQALPAVLPAALLGVWILARWATAPAPAAALPGALKQELGVVLFLVALLECGGARATQRFVSWLLTAAWVAALYALAQGLGLDPLAWRGAFGGAAFATLSSPTGYALFAAACVPLIFARFGDPERSDALKLADAVLLGLLVASVALTRSLQAYFAFNIAAAVSAAPLPGFLPSRSSMRVGFSAFGLCLVAGTVFAFAGSRLGITAPDLAGARSSLWSAPVRMLRERPLSGVGPGRFALELDERRSPPLLAVYGHDARPEHAPSAAAEAAAELGLPGGLLWLWTFGAVLLLAWRARKRFIQRAALKESAQLAGLFGAVITLLIDLQFNAADPSAAGWLLWPLAGLCAGVSLLAARGPVAVLPVALGELGRRRLATASLLAFAGLLVFPARWQDADITLNAAVAAARSGAYGEAARLAQAADVLGAPRALEARYVGGSALLAAGRPEEALRRFAALEAEAPAFALLQYEKGRAQLKLGNWELAQASFERQQELDPSFVPNLEGLAVAAKEAGHYDAARKAALAAIALEPQDPVHYMALSDIYRRERRLSEAEDAQQRARLLKRQGRAKTTGGA